MSHALDLRRAIRGAARLAGVACLLALPRLAGAQDDRLASHLDPGTRAQVQAVVDSARVAGLPTEPLVDKALEGARKGANGERITRAVRSLAMRMREGRAGLGVVASESELIAAAAALQAGISRETLTRLREARPAKSLAVPLVVLSDLVTRGVPRDTAAAVILLVARDGMPDEAFLTLQREVQRDVQGGAPPASAAAIRTRGVLTGGVVKRRPATASTTDIQKGATTGAPAKP